MSKIVLYDILKNYENKLCDKTYILELSGGQTIRIKFFREQLCHLLGIQHVFGNDRAYLGTKGFLKILDGSITTEKLKAHNKREYQKIKERLNHFNEISELLEKGTLIRFYIDRVVPKTVIKADFCIFYENQTYILHLFLIKESSSDYYAPTSFVVKSCNDKEYRQFVKNQEYKKIIGRQIEM